AVPAEGRARPLGPVARARRAAPGRNRCDAAGRCAGDRAGHAPGDGGNARPGRRTRTPAGGVTTMGRKSGTILYLDGVSVSFDGFRAINNLSLVLDRGEMRAIIGPNGAGKTTMMDIVT